MKTLTLPTMKKLFFFYALCVRQYESYFTNQVVMVLQKVNQKTNQSYAEYDDRVDLYISSLMVHVLYTQTVML